MGTEIQNQKGQRTTDKTMRQGLTGKRGRRAHQNQRATTAHQRQPCQCGIGGPRTQPTKPTQCPQIQKTGQGTRQIMVTRTPRDSKSPQGHEQGPERTGAKRRERKRERELDVDPKAPTPPPPPPPEFASRGANPILPIIQARHGPIPGSYHGECATTPPRDKRKRDRP